MDIKLLPANSTCLVDANILLYHIAGTSADCKGFLQRVANEEVQAHLTTIIIAEVLHRQMLIEEVSTGSGSDRVAMLLTRDRDDRDPVATLSVLTPSSASRIR